MATASMLASRIRASENSIVTVDAAAAAGFKLTAAAAAGITLLGVRAFDVHAASFTAG